MKGRDISIAILGAGFSGVCMGIRLMGAGIDSFTIYEAKDDVGGTWRDNTYPGCACDVPSHLYSYSFDTKADWTRKFSYQPEIQAYLLDCVDRFALRDKIRVGCRIVEARFDEASGRWTLKTEAGEAIEADVVVSGTGPLSQPVVPDLPGLERFEGKTFHSATWDHDFSLEGKRVAVVGTGASAIQFIPRIAPEVGALHVFQRTPPWILPKPDRPFTGLEKRLFARVPGWSRLYRAGLYWVREIGAAGFVKEPRLLRLLSKLARRHIHQQVQDPELRRRVTPSYTMGCKRILISDDYYPALSQDHVEVIPHGVDRVTERAVVAHDGTEREVDAIIFGTGFDASAFLSAMTVVGRDGQELNEVWRDGAEAYLGLAVAGFPNLFMLVGPNTGLGHNSIIFMIEAQVRYVLDCIERMRAERLKTLEVRPAEQRRFNEELHEKMSRTVWSTGCQSWYLDENGKNFTLWPGFTWEYWLRTRRHQRHDFEARPATSHP